MNNDIIILLSPPSLKTEITADIENLIKNEINIITNDFFSYLYENKNKIKFKFNINRNIITQFHINEVFIIDINNKNESFNNIISYLNVHFNNFNINISEFSPIYVIYNNKTNTILKCGVSICIMKI